MNKVKKNLNKSDKPHWNSIKVCTNPKNWVVKKEGMTQEEYDEAIRIHRNKLCREWRKKNPGYHTRYMKEYRKLQPEFN